MEKKKKDTRLKKKKTIKSKNEQIDIETKNEIFGLLLMVLGIIFFISVFSSKMGIVGRIVYRLLSVLFGSANYIFPLILVFWGILYNLKATKHYTRRYIICTSIIFLCLLVLLDSSKELDLTLVDRINRSIEYLSVTRSGGIIGAVLGFFVYKLLGSLGTYIFLGVIILVNLYIILRTNIDQILMFFEDLGEFIEDKKLKFREKQREREDRIIAKEMDPNSHSFKEKNAHIFGKLKAKLKGLEKDQVKNELMVKKDDKNAAIILEDYPEEISSFTINEYDKKNIRIEEKPKQEFKKETRREAKIEKERSKDLSEDLSEEDKREFENIKESAESENYVFPDISLLNQGAEKNAMSNKDIIRNGKIIEQTLDNFGIDCTITAINKGPVITCYELKPAPGIKLSKIVGLSDNISMALASSDIRIEAPIPGKTVVGIEIANKVKDSVSLREMLESNEFQSAKNALPLTLGKDVEGNIIISSIDDMPHLLIAGATGSGKSVCINGIITTLLYKSSPKDVRFILIDPKVVELGVYNGIPHLLIPVVTNPKKAGYALSWAVGEMEKRYKLFSEMQVRDIKSYNKKLEKEGREGEKLARIVIIVDELADLMMVAAKEVEDYIIRLAQMARAAGMYLIIATQRPSVDVITGIIKANIPSRIAFAVSSQVDSRTIIDMGGAEKLLGKGDMLFYPSNYPKPKRIQGAFVSDEEVERVVDFIKLNNQVEENKENQKVIEDQIKEQERNEDLDLDPLFRDAINFVVTDEQASVSYLQRKLKIGYSRAARIVDQMEEMEIIGPHEGSKPRKLLKTKEEIDKLLGDEDE
ncbi:FtsK/SpoIIIE family DNA translocase [Peptoniphilus raoultii]|uniref:FtsK/SpoIIIE family DNA translocase n=1 Tax=Peptoniphilus raoultii TaxID=1776387 RepID=UPI0008D92DE0|nr:DNA translocase FtsK [Peptoniphilus raoultii]